MVLSALSRSATRAVGLIFACALSYGCSADAPLTGPSTPPPPSAGSGSGNGNYTDQDITPVGTVVPTADGYTLNGELKLNAAGREVTFARANLRVTTDAQGRLVNMSGSVQIPSPHERISFADPIQADVGLFSGKFLNEQRDLKILLKEDTDYFVYRVKTEFSMSIATGETGASATKPISVGIPFGGEILFICDYNDPMYYIHAAHDLLGDAGFGWSLNSRIPFVPKHPVNGLGTFDGRTTRTGTFNILKVLAVTGQMVDNEYFETHQTTDNPLGAHLRRGYQSGANGSMNLDLSLSAKKRNTEVATLGLSIPLAEASAGVWSEVGTQNGFQGHSYLKGVTTDDFSWWPAFIPAKPLTRLEVGGFIKSDGDHSVEIFGRYGWQLPSGNHSMSGRFTLSPEAMQLEGKVESGSDVFEIRGRITNTTTSVAIPPVKSILDGVASRVNSEVGAAISDAQRAWEELQKATANYQFELSLRGLRSTLPTIVDGAKAKITQELAKALEDHEGKVYYETLKSHMTSAAAPYRTQLDALKKAALDTRDDATTRKAMETALRNLADMKTLKTTYNYKVFGVTVASVPISVPILSNAQADKLILAADNMKYLPATSEMKVRMQDVYNRVNGREIFEQVRDNISNGVLQIPSLSEFGFTVLHSNGAFSVYAIIAGSRHTLNTTDVFSIPAITEALAQAAIVELRR